MMLSQLLLPCSLGLWAFAAGAITIPVDPDVAPLRHSTSGAVTSVTDLFHRSCPEEVPPRTSYTPEVLMSSFADFGSSGEDVFPNGTMFPSSDSLVRGAIEAWAQHQALVLRPDEIWFEILVQMNFYMTKHAEDIRHLFVDYKGKEEIQVRRFSWHEVIAAFGTEIQKRVKTDWLLDWIMPGFSTSNENDGLTATVLMMGLLQHYFSFSAGITCGLPEVTLLGEREDWAKLLGKLDRLEEFGAEPTDYAARLRPILTRFVQSWDEPQSDATKTFWGNIVRAKRQFSCGIGPEDFRITGWITGFLHWTTRGDLRISKILEEQYVPNKDDLVIDNVTYFSESLDNVPVGYAKAPLKMLDYPHDGVDTMAYLLAGNVGVKRLTKASGGGSEAGDEGGANATVTAQPMSAWFMYAPVNTTMKAGPPYGSGQELMAIASVMQTCKL